MSSIYSEDPNLWISSHCESLKKREQEYMELSQELEMLVEIHKDMESLVKQQQSPLDKTETYISDSLHQMLHSNIALNLAHKFQKSSTLIQTGGFLILGTALGSGIGSFALLIGIKPLMALAIGGGVGALISGMVATKIE